MQDFNQISSLWQSQENIPKLASADEMLSAIKNHIHQNKKRNKNQILVLILAFLLLNIINFSINFQFTTHLGLFIISIGLLSALFQFYQLHQLLAKSDFSQETHKFIDQTKAIHRKKIQLYQRYYWWYTVLLILGMLLFVFELSEMYEQNTLIIVSLFIALWVLICTIWIRKMTISKIKKEQMLLFNKIQKFENTSVD